MNMKNDFSCMGGFFWNNASLYSQDIRLDWEVYNIEDDDDQLIDLIIDVGDPYPKNK